ncbi:SAC3/GANP/Nin1/mts3/eIF-3 p25 family-domain-containing protein [Scheffersomyces coipomensis]|uniref:SAC3/GANP/Nin1/mts3/eIF-3 p25 family-domain-containing protein n=1 Tax=Scheffersomyces coipomensis TaxID=1788519 RepID=UPI00315D931A
MPLQKLSEELYKAFDQGDYTQCQKILPPIRIELIKHNLLVPLLNDNTNKNKINDLRISQRILEIGVLSSLLSHNYTNFENYFSQLKPFYLNKKLYHKHELNTDTTKIISLNLLYLLSKGLISKFHIELEIIYNSNQYNIDQDKYLQFPINLERNLMEGNYIKIWKLLNQTTNLPCFEYEHFIDTLIHALRFEISKSIEKTYKFLPINNCKNLLYFPQEQSDSQFEKELLEEFNINNWRFENGNIYFDQIEEDEDLDLDSGNEPIKENPIIKNVLNYSEQIESIV